MGSEEPDIADDDVSGGEKQTSRSNNVPCSICFDLVAFNNDRSCVKLVCGHQFHLDCIGSAFNFKGAMMCPNCRNIEKGQWLYAVGCSGCEEPHDDDFYELSYSEMSFGVRWCPFTFSQLPSSFEEGEFLSTAYHDLMGHHTIFPDDHPSFPSATRPCPYIAYYGPISSSTNSTGSVSDSSSFNHNWNGLSGPSEIPGSYAFPPMDPHYRIWEHHSPPFSATVSRHGRSDQPSSFSQRPARTSADIPMPGSFLGHSSGTRAGSSNSRSSSMIHPYPGSAARARDRVQALQAYFQPPSSSPEGRTAVASGSRGASSQRAMAPPAPSSNQAGGGFYVFPSNRNFLQAENPIPRSFHSSWERDHLASSRQPPSQVDRESIWGPLHQVAASGSGGFRQRQG